TRSPPSGVGGPAAPCQIDLDAIFGLVLEEYLARSGRLADQATANRFGIEHPHRLVDAVEPEHAVQRPEHAAMDGDVFVFRCARSFVEIVLVEPRRVALESRRHPELVEGLKGNEI